MKYMIKTIAEAEQALAPYVAVAWETTMGKGITTERTLDLSRAVGSPHERLKVIHVAGTSGKTSTSYFVSRLLASTGASVGLTVSPHIYSLTERIQINTVPLGDGLFCEYLSEYLELVGRSKQMPSYFELMIVFALWVFDKQRLDYVVLETGLGGLHDSSNICRRDDKVCVITDIGLDHTDILGNTLSEIAAQKAGIIAPRNQVIMHEQADEIVDVVRNAAGIMNASLDILPSEEYKTYQDRNSRLAFAVARYVAERDNLELPGNALRKLDTTVPGRMQIVKRGESTIILDGAHNEQKTAALIKTLQNKYPGQKFALVVAIKQTKDYQKVVELLSTVASRVIATNFQLSQHAPINSIEPRLIQSAFRTRGIECDIAGSVEQATNQLVQMAEPYVLVTGSLYFLAQVGYFCDL